MIATLVVNNPLNKDHGKRKYAKVTYAYTENGKKYYRFHQCTLPEHVLTFIKKR